MALNQTTAHLNVYDHLTDRSGDSESEHLAKVSVNGMQNRDAYAAAWSTNLRVRVRLPAERCTVSPAASTATFTSV